MANWINTKHKGIRYREHESRKFGARKDRYYSIRLMVDGKRVEEALGWESHWKQAHPKGAISLEQEAIRRRAELLQNKHEGAGPRTMAEQRKENEAQRKAEEEARAAEERASIPFSEIWKQYIDQCRTDGKKSIDREQSFFTHWISKVIGDKPLAEIAPIHLQKLKSEMTKGGNSPRSIHYCLAVVRQVFNFSIKHGLFSGDNPVGKVDKPTVDNRRMRFLSFEEAEKLLEALKLRSLDCWRITLISLHCGLRFSEIAGLTWGDVDVERNTITARDTKNTKSRHAPMTDQVRQALLEMVLGNRSELIFPDRTGGERQQMSDTFDRVVESLGLNEGVTDPRQKVVFHTCRHTFASWHAEAGVDLLTLRDLLGHRSVAMVERYSHLHPDRLQAAARNLGDRLAGGKSEDTNGKVIPLRADSGIDWPAGSPRTRTAR